MREGGTKGEGGETNDLVRFVDCPLPCTDGGFARLAMQLGDLVELLGDVGLGELEVGLIGSEELRARVRVERVGRHC